MGLLDSIGNLTQRVSSYFGDLMQQQSAVEDKALHRIKAAASATAIRWHGAATPT